MIKTVACIVGLNILKIGKIPIFSQIVSIIEVFNFQITMISQNPRIPRISSFPNLNKIKQNYLFSIN